MDQIRKLIGALSMRQRITIVATALLVIGALIAFTHWHTESDFKPLYTSLGPEDAAAVVQKLKEAGTEYRISESGSTVSAPSARVAELRLELAAAGIPKTGRIGYELFDKANFGATEFTEHLNYHRALEGELERSISAISEVEQARVHLTFPKDSVFLDSRQPAKASVLVKIRLGSRMSAQNIAAVTNLVASAVEGLAPEAVSVLDMRGNLLSRPREANNGDQPSEATLEYKQKIENELLAKVNGTLEPLLGTDKFRAGVSVDCDFSTAEQSEETLDPNKSVMVTSQKSEEQSGGSLASGQPGTGSTLPRPVSRPGSSNSGLSRRTENIAYQSSRVVRHTKLPQGTVKRMSISVLVDHTVRMEGQGAKAKRVVTPPTPESLKVIHDIVAAVTGFSTERGDQLVIESLPFESTRNFEQPMGEPAAPAADPRIPRWLAPYVKNFSTLLIGAGVGAVLLLFLLGTAMLLFRKKKKVVVTTQEALEAGHEGAGSEVTAPMSEQAKANAAEEQAAKAAQAALQEEQEIINSLRIPVATTKKADVLIKHIREGVTRDAEAHTNVLRSWLNESEGAK